MMIVRMLVNKYVWGTGLLSVVCIGLTNEHMKSKVKLHLNDIYCLNASMRKLQPGDQIFALERCGGCIFFKTCYGIGTITFHDPEQRKITCEFLDQWDCLYSEDFTYPTTFSPNSLQNNALVPIDFKLLKIPQYSYLFMQYPFMKKIE